MLVFMVKGLFNSLHFPYAQFPCTALAGDQFFDPFWEAVARLEFCGFKVLALTCDGLGANRRLFHLHNPSNRSFLNKVENPYAPERSIYFFINPPHLLKTVRNGWANKRRLWCNSKESLWQHLVELYECNRCGTDGLVLIPKLKYEHIVLTSFSKMRVDLAAQALSSSVVKGLEMLKKDEMSETIKFVDIIDKWFDCLNVSCFSKGKLTQNPFKSPYRSDNDQIKVVEGDIPPIFGWMANECNRKI
uniref:Uncharacterized protein n=1 Tax=Amphimedon queenslandica TaxID=400682 RepID=A0A1X7UPC8_AMPQE